VNFDKLVKKLARLFKKLTESGQTFKFKIIEEGVKAVPVYDIDPINNVKYDTHNDVLVDVVTFELEFDRYAVDGFEVGAIVERTIDEHVNLVYTVAEDIDFADYRDCAFRCDHCGTNHNRKKVAVLVNRATGEHRMVGLSCLHDYVGWEISNFATYLTEIEEILNNGDDLAINRSDLGCYKVYIPTFEYLASCIRLTNEKGYFKNLKYEAIKKMADITDADKTRHMKLSTSLKSTRLLISLSTRPSASSLVKFRSPQRTATLHTLTRCTRRFLIESQKSRQGLHRQVLASMLARSVQRFPLWQLSILSVGTKPSTAT
jgi:hypothetical protein